MSLNTEEICEKLQSTERRPKLEVLEQLQSLCGERQSTSVDQLQTIFDECYLHLLKCYSDRFESVRDKAVHTVTGFIQCLPPNDFHLLNVTATLSERMGQQETVEQSEEIRLLYVGQLHVLVQHYVATGRARSLPECYADMVRVLVKALRDSYPAVQREGCACVVSLTRAAEAFTFQPCVEPLTKPLYSMLNHKHSQVRISAVGALARLALHINTSDDAVPWLIMEVSPLLMDAMPLVRRECGEMGVLLLLELRDRYSFFERIIPLVLCCLKDDSPEVVEYIRPRWVACGKQYYDENETELNKQDLADPQVPNYPEGVQRPTIGCRGMVQRALRLLKLITRETSDWKENVRLHALKLLYQFVLHAEAAMTAKFFEIYSDVACACRDSVPMVAKEALKVSDLMGRLLCYDDWYEHGFDGLARNAKEGYLKCFYQMFTASLGPQMRDVLRVADMLVEKEFSQTLKPEFQMYVLKMLQTLLNKAEHFKQERCASGLTSGEEAETASHELLDGNAYVACIKVMALSLEADQANTAQLQQMGNEILEKIAARQQLPMAALHEKYFARALEYVENLDAALDALNEPILLLHGLLSIAKFRSSYMQPLQKQIQLVWQHCADDAKVKIFSGISIAMLSWSETMATDVEESVEILREFVGAIVEPHLQWQAGANAEAMRALAMATLCSMSQGAAEEAQLVLPTLAKYMPSLLEDHAVSTRHYAVKCMFNFGALTLEAIKPIAYAILQRLDDPSSGIRELAARAIPKLCPKFEKEKGEEGEYEHHIWEIFIKKALDMMFLHYEGPEVRLKNAIKASIVELAENYPELCKESYQLTAAMSYNPYSLVELQQELPILI